MSSSQLPSMSQAASPFLILHSDPGYNGRPSARALSRAGRDMLIAYAKKCNRGKSIKVLTKFNPWLTLKTTINRKDDRMASISKHKTNILQTGSIALLAIFAVAGVTDVLGGSLKDAAAAALLAGLLFVLATDTKR